MKIHRREIGNICILALEGEIDAEHCPQLKQALAQARKDGLKHFVLDFNQVSFIDSTGLGVLISLMRHLKELEGQLRLTGLQQEVRSIFEITRLFRVFDRSASVQDAIGEIQKQS